MNFKMIMTAGYPEMAKMIRRIAAELGLNVTVVEGILSEAAQEVKHLIDQGGFEVVISRAGTAKAIGEIINLPIVHSDSDHFDLLQAFKKARELGEKICFITFPEGGFLFNFGQIIELLGFNVTILKYKNWEELVNQIKVAKEIGIDVVVGGGIRASELARSHGMQSMDLTTSERTIKRSLLLAAKIGQDRLFIKKEAERLKAVINVSEEGILFVNKNGQIETFNPAAERIFGVKEYMVIDKNIEDLNNDQLSNLLNPKWLYSDNQNITLQNINVLYEPVIVGHERIGTLITCREIKRIQQLENKIRRDLHAKGLVARFTLEDIIHNGEKMKDVITLAGEYAATDSTILLIGESGTGKELFAQGIHNASKRKDGPFVAVNCAALPENLLESELFGYAEGAFTGANKGGRQGVFELAHGGTIFLDEIGEIPPHIQTRLLRVLQEKEVMRVGGDRVTPVDIRIVAATNRKLWDLVQEGKFRLDLYFRLSVLHVQIPALRERREDIPILIDHFLKRLNSTISYDDFSEQLKSFFMSYAWPGNIRNLENLIERYHLRVNHLKDELSFINDVVKETEDSFTPNHDSSNTLVVEKGTMDDIERQIIEQMLDRYNNNKKLVAEKLGISRTTLWKKINE